MSRRRAEKPRFSAIGVRERATECLDQRLAESSVVPEGFFRRHENRTVLLRMQAAGVDDLYAHGSLRSCRPRKKIQRSKPAQTEKKPGISRAFQKHPPVDQLVICTRWRVFSVERPPLAHST